MLRCAPRNDIFLVRCRLLRLRSAEGGAPYSINGNAVNDGMGRPIPYKVDLSSFVIRRAGACPCRMHRTLFLPC